MGLRLRATVLAGQASLLASACIIFPAGLSVMGRDANRAGVRCLLLLTCSRSGGIGAELFHKIVAGAAAGTGLAGAILQHLQASSDHPTTLVFPEGEYLKGLTILKRAWRRRAPPARPTGPAAGRTCGRPR